MTKDTPARIRALCLFSGGLDSQLAVCLLREQGIEVHGVVFDSPFFDVRPARRAATKLALSLYEVDFTRDIVELINNPRYGFGSGINPCIDCHGRMLKRAGELMEEKRFQFLCTGEVLNERPMSQTRQSLVIVARDSGYADLVLRPLSAKLLPETLPERLKWVDRERLLALSGRNRKPQLELAARYGLADFPAPAGGCRLTDPNFARRVRDLRSHEGLGGVRALQLLRVGRHFRLSDRVKLIVGRNAMDNATLESSVELYDLLLKVQNVPGPTALIPISAREDEIRLAAAICARYADSEPGCPVIVRVRAATGERTLEVTPATPEEVQRLLV
ncbi:MAG: tRNA 4-thiouridine(8) synthase ThiI [Kiritimatiellae bacterium]|nr:tRNA 4-thiouridine(8) synthase ThiI [Kiritimatiellia bacterium]